MQQMGDGAGLGDAAVDNLRGLCDEGALITPGHGENSELHFESGEVLTQAIVETASDAAALIVLQREDTAAEAASRDLGALAVGDVGVDFHSSNGSAGYVPQSRPAAGHDDPSTIARRL